MHPTGMEARPGHQSRKDRAQRDPQSRRPVPCRWTCVRDSPAWQRQTRGTARQLPPGLCPDRAVAGVGGVSSLLQVCVPAPACVSGSSILYPPRHSSLQLLQPSWSHLPGCLGHQMNWADWQAECGLCFTNATPPHEQPFSHYRHAQTPARPLSSTFPIENSSPTISPCENSLGRSWACLTPSCLPASMQQSEALWLVPSSSMQGTIFSIDLPG